MSKATGPKCFLIQRVRGSLLIMALIFPATFALTLESAEAQTQQKQRQKPKQRTSTRVSAPLTKPSSPFSRPSSKQSLDLQRESSALPRSQALKAVETKPRSLGQIKPPKSNSFYEAGSKEAEYERLVDEEIKVLFKLSQQNRRSPNRGEIWLRLGERYVEKSRLVDFRAQADYDKKLKDFLDKRTKAKPRIDLGLAREYNQKAVELYEWFVKDFPNDSKVDQALFFLGYNQFELGNTQLGEGYYTQLVERFPNSAYITESYFALGEFYFENELWQKALDSYQKVIVVKRARLNTFALYKSAWCLYRVGRVPTGLKALERVVRMSRAAESQDNISGRRAVNKVRLASEALKDYVPFYAEAGDPKEAAREFERLTGDEKQAVTMLEKLAFIYADSGNRPAATLLFKQLIAMDPGGERAAEYQYQVVLAYASSDQKEFRSELDAWLENFGPASAWSKQNARNEKLVNDVAKLQETTLRNNVLQLHQTAQNSRAEYSQKMANSAYSQYMKYFAQSPQATEMQFFQGELLFDMGRFEDAARVYSWVADREGPNAYKEKAIVNAVLALEKELPDAKTIESKRGNSVERIPFDPPVARFEKAALRYIQTFPKGEKTQDIQRRLGVLYYSYNHFDEAIPVFEKLLRDDPKSANAEIAGNLILDIYKIRNDMVGFAEKGQQFLADPGIANSKFGTQVKGMLEKANYIRAEKIGESGDSAKSAREFETFASTYRGSTLAAAARFKAAQGYEKAGDIVSAVRMHGLVLATPSSDPKVRSAQNDSRNALARIYQQTGQFELAAKQYQSYAAANPKDPKAINGYYNAGLLWDSLGEPVEALQAYQAYFDQSRNSDRVEILFLQAEIHRKRGSFSKAQSLYDQYLKTAGRSEAHSIQSAFAIADMGAKQGQRAKAQQWYQTTVELHRNAGKSGKDAGVKYAAEARFNLAQETLNQLMSIRFTSNDRQQAQAATQIKSLREKYINEMKEVIKLDNGPYIVAALASSGQMFDSLAQSFARIPVPAGFAAEDATKYKELIQTQINGFKIEAKNSYKSAVEKSHELEAYSPWTKVAQAGLTGVDASASGEIASDARAADWMGL